MRLYDTGSGSSASCRAARADPDVLLRPDRLPAHPHRQRAAVRALDVAHALARAHRLRGHARREHHRHQRQDLRGRAGGERRARRERERLVRRGHERARARPARPRAEGDRDDSGDRRDDRGARRERPRVRGRRRRLLPRRELPRLRPALGPPRRRGRGAQPVRGGRGRRAEGGPARLRALEGAQGGRGHLVGLAVGPRPAGLAHRVLGDGGGLSRARVRDPRRRARPRSSRTTRTRSRSRARPAASSRRSGCTTGCCGSPARRCRSRSGTSSRYGTRSESWGRETLLVYFLGGHWRKPLDFSDDTLEQAAAQAESFRNVFRSESEPGGDWERLAAALDDDFNTPEALAVMHGWRDHELLRRGLEVFGLGVARRERERARRAGGAGAAARGGEGRKDFAEGDRLRDEIEAAGWQVRDVDAEPASSSFRSGDLRARLRPAAGARGRCAGRARCASSGRPSGRCGRSRG